MENKVNKTVHRDFLVEQRMRASLAADYRREVTRINVRHFSLLALLLALVAWYILSIAVDTTAISTTVPEYRQQAILCLEQIISAL